MVLGPLDKRTIRTRCRACAQRRIKCEGGRPCNYCTKKDIDCVSQASKTQQGLVILNKTPNEDQEVIVQKSQNHVLDCRRLYAKDRSQHCVNQFFTSYVANNEFGVSIDLDTIIYQFQSSPSLYHAIVAIGALDLSSKKVSQQEFDDLVAIRAYRTSVVNFQTEIEKNGFLESDAGLWTTFFLGLFELMNDVSGEGWVKHILYGTSKILQLRGPAVYQSGSSRSFFVAVRVFEICRSIIYSEPTFLSQKTWRTAMSKLWEGEFRKDWHPKETLLDLMLDCSALNQRAIKATGSDVLLHEQTQTLLEIIDMGALLRSSLELWHASFIASSLQNSLLEADTRSKLATVYYHAISIYLSGIFDYRPQFNDLLPPTLPYDEIQIHVHGILAGTKTALDTTKLAGILFFFPLRVAGARAVSTEHRLLIVEMLKEISTRNFVVANAFVLDLKNLWSSKFRWK